MVKPMSWRSRPVCVNRSLTQSMIMRGSLSLKRRYAGVCATATIAMSVLLDAVIDHSPRVFLERLEVDVGLTRRHPPIDDLVPGATAVVQPCDRSVIRLLPHRTESHADPEVVERDVTDVDTHDRLIAVVEQDRAADVRLGLLLAVVLHRRDDRERDDRAPVGDDHLVGLGEWHACEVVVATTGYVD